MYLLNHTMEIMITIICHTKILKKSCPIISCYINSVTIHSSHIIYLSWFMTHYNHSNIFISTFCKIINYILIKLITHIIKNNYLIFEFEYIFHCDHIFIAQIKSSIGLSSLRINPIPFIFTYYDYGPPVICEAESLMLCQRLSVMGLRQCFAMFHHGPPVIFHHTLLFLFIFLSLLLLLLGDQGQKPFYLVIIILILFLMYLDVSITLNIV